jgi:hypothetical protein
MKFQHAELVDKRDHKMTDLQRTHARHQVIATNTLDKIQEQIMIQVAKKRAAAAQQPSCQLAHSLYHSDCHPLVAVVPLVTSPPGQQQQQQDRFALELTADVDGRLTEQWPRLTQAKVDAMLLQVQHYQDCATKLERIVEAYRVHWNAVVVLTKVTQCSSISTMDNAAESGATSAVGGENNGRLDDNVDSAAAACENSSLSKSAVVETNAAILSEQQALPKWLVDPTNNSESHMNMA